MRKALFFGSFNPLHIGHISIAKYVLDNTDVDCLSFVLSPHNPFKDGDILSDANERLSILKRAIDDINNYRCNKKIGNFYKPLTVCDVEFSLPEPLYTYNTLLYLKTKYPDDELILIIGADNCAELERWHRGFDLIKEYEIWVYPRTGFNAKELCKKYGCIYLDAPIVNISSTLIREMEFQGKDMSQYKNISYFCMIFDNK